MIGWIADALQIAWGFVYWNARKSWFRSRRGRVPCPCQTPSDSGRAMETGCEPALMLKQPERFQVVCPLLKPDAKGQWRCSVNTPDVRPFWGRAFGAFGLSLVCLYVIGTLGAWSLLRARGYPISYLQVVWPPAWHEFHGVQGRYFAQKANRALAQNDVGEAVMSLSVAYQLDPGNYGIGLLLARLTQSGQPALADRVYAQLIRHHPNRRAETFSAWYESLLWRGDFPAIIALCREALKEDDGHRTAWLNALIFAIRRESSDATLEQLAKETKFADVRSVVNLELQTRGEKNAARTALLATPPADASPYLGYYRPKRLIELGFPDNAITLLSSPTLPLPPRDRIALRLEAYTALGWLTLLRGDIDTLCGPGMNDATAEILAAYLVRHPDRELFQVAIKGFERHGEMAKENLYRAWSGWLCAAGACKDFESFRAIGEEMKKISGSEFRALKPLEGFFRGEGASTRIESYLPSVQPLPLGLTYALLEQYYRPRGVVPKS